MSALETEEKDRLSRSRSNCFGVFFGSMAGIAIGWLSAVSLTRLPSGYLAPYTNLSVLMMALFFGVPGLLFVPSGRTRGIGLGLVFAGALSLASYNVGWRVLLKEGQIPWKPPEIYLPEGKQSNVVIKFKGGVTESQITNFISSRLAFLPNWADSLTVSTHGGQQPRELRLHIAQDTPAKSKFLMPKKMVEKNVSALMVILRRDSRVSTVEVESEP